MIAALTPLCSGVVFWAVAAVELGRGAGPHAIRFLAGRVGTNAGEQVI